MYICDSVVYDANEIHKGANLSCRMMLHITSKQSNQITKEDYKQHSRRQQKYVCIYLCSSLIQMQFMFDFSRNTLLIIMYLLT